MENLDYKKMKSAIEQQLEDNRIAYIPCYDGYNYVITHGKENTFLVNKKNYKDSTVQKDTLEEILDHLHWMENIL